MASLRESVEEPKGIRKLGDVAGDAPSLVHGEHMGGIVRPSLFTVGSALRDGRWVGQRRAKVYVSEAFGRQSSVHCPLL